jgi:hypothetical protein
MSGYFLNDIFIKGKSNTLVNNFFNNYLFKNRLNPLSSSYRIEDNKIILIYNDIAYEFFTDQNKSLIEYYNTRYTDLYSCCLNTQKLKVYLPYGTFNLPNGNIQNSSKKYETYDIANPSISCTGITENECTFFKRWYCRGLRDLVGVDDMSLYDSNCNCYRFHPKNQVFIKMGNYVNCYDSLCTSNTDPILTTNICQSTICSNMLILKDILAGENINISNVALNLSCK